MQPIRRFNVQAGGYNAEVRVFADGVVMVKYGGAVLPLSSSSMPSSVKRDVLAALK